MEEPEHHLHRSSMDDQTKTKYTPVTHVIFELDGILLDTFEIQKKRLNHVFFTKRGIKIKPESWYTIQGQSDEDQINVLYDEYCLKKFPRRIRESPHTLLNEYRSGTMLDYLLCDIMPGARRLVSHLKHFDIPMAICSSTTPQFYSKKIRNHYQFFDCNFHHATLLGITTPNGKPSSDLHIQCARDFNPEDPPQLSKCLAFEASMAGTAAAITSDMQVVMVPNSFLMGSKLMKYPTIAIRHLDDFIPEMFGLPPYCECANSKQINEIVRTY
ncbi:pseudouridine-5'-phosphatase-like [Chrysoperla carnea]|uniref:pseudouridine-5'-phosphatase-like n=1 Tax=Chrysoperla carnea TaxID=189513 RepID=UPI001D091B9C|nr:pseudouridine-5'-phosphatase-like [Chrysoperla carnea]